MLAGSPHLRFPPDAKTAGTSALWALARPRLGEGVFHIGAKVFAPGHALFSDDGKLPGVREGRACGWAGAATAGASRRLIRARGFCPRWLPQCIWTALAFFLFVSFGSQFSGALSALGTLFNGVEKVTSVPQP